MIEAEHRGSVPGRVKWKRSHNALVILQQKVAGVSQSALERFLSRARRAAGLSGKINVLIAGNSSIRQLNRTFRRKDTPTDVLSFPAASAPRSELAGEIAISVDIARENADRLGHPLSAEIKILILHGVLHLAGYDHESDHGQMARQETKLRRTLGLPASLIERTVSKRPQPRARRRSSNFVRRPA